jgi:hypothetical protein
MRAAAQSRGFSTSIREQENYNQTQSLMMLIEAHSPPNPIPFHKLESATGYSIRVLFHITLPCLLNLLLAAADC